jgi:hypothetical protein
VPGFAPIVPRHGAAVVNGVVRELREGARLLRLSVLALAWTVIRGRLRLDALTLAGAVLTVTLAATLLASGPIYADAVYVAGARSTLGAAPPEQVNITVATTIGSDAYASVDSQVMPVLAEAIAPVGGSVAGFGTSESYALPDQATVRDLTQFVFADDLPTHASLISGQWPAGSGDTMQAVVSDVAAGWLDESTGDRIDVASRFDKTLVDVHIVGTFHIDDPRDPYWAGQSLLLSGVDEGTSFTTYGPLVVSRATFLSALAARPVSATWQASPHTDAVTTGTLPILSQHAAAVPGRIDTVSSPVALRVSTDLPRAIDEIEQSLLATRAGVQIITAQLVLLAAYALILTASLLSDRRTTETALLASRGASVRQLTLTGLVEGVLLVIPAVVAGPFIAVAILKLLNAVGPLAGIGVALEPHVQPRAFVYAAAAGLLCVLMFVLPAALSARSALRTQLYRERASRRGLLSRLNLDLVLLLLAAIGYVQLRHYQQPITQTASGRLDVDPMLGLAPGLALLAGAVVALRVVPLLLRVIERLAKRSTRFTAALGGWQVARRPRRFTRVTLLLVLAIGIGLFATSYTWTWKSSQRDQAAFQVGADVRLQPNRRQQALPDLVLADAYSQVDGVEASMPVDLHSGDLESNAGRVQTILLDADAAAGIVRMRTDLAHDDLPSLMDRLTAGRPTVPGIAIPGEPQRLALDLSVYMQPRCDPVDEDDEDKPPTPPGCLMIPGEWPGMDQQFSATVSPAITIQDADGQIYRMRGPALPTVPAPERGIADPTARQRVVFPLTTTLESGTVVGPRFPINLLTVDLDLLSPQFIPRKANLTMFGIAVSGEREGDAWTALSPSQVGDSGVWEMASSAFAAGLGSSPEGEMGPPQSGTIVAIAFSSGYATGAGPLLSTISLRLKGFAPAPSIPVIVSDSLLSSAGLRPGDTLRATFAGDERDLTIVGTVSAFPGTDPDAGVLIADLETLSMLRIEQPGGSPAPARERWIRAAPGEVESVATALSDPPFESSRLESRVGRIKQLQTDPVALGTIGALSTGFASAIVFAVIGFVLSTLASARERTTEFALLRAIGLAPRQLLGWLGVENGYLTVTSLVLGTALGLALSWLILPLVVLTQEASRAFPPVRIVIPWMRLALLQLAVLAALVTVSLILTVVLRRRGLGQVLRIGED